MVYDGVARTKNEMTVGRIRTDLTTRRKICLLNHPVRACINVEIESVPRICLLTDSVDRDPVLGTNDHY